MHLVSLYVYGMAISHYDLFRRITLHGETVGVVFSAADASAWLAWFRADGAYLQTAAYDSGVLCVCFA